MKVKNNIKLIIIVLVSLLCLIYIINSYGTGGKTLAQGNPANDFARVNDLYGDSRVDEAIALLEKIINENPGTRYEALARISLANIYAQAKRDGIKMMEQFEIVARDFKGTSYGMQADMFIIDQKYLKEGSFNTWLSKTNEALVRYGGVDVYEILKSSDDDNYRDSWFEKIKAINPEFREVAFPATYADIAGRLNNVGVERFDDEIKMYHFVRIYFPKYFENWKSINYIYDLLLDKRGIKDWNTWNDFVSKFPDDVMPPTIRPIAPHDGLTIGETMPKLEVELYDGDISQKQVDLFKTEFTLDGQDLTDKMKVRSQINKSMQLGTVFEKIRLEY